MCPKDVTDIRMPKRDVENRFMGPPIIELEFKKDILDPHIIIRGENIQLQMKKERPTLYKIVTSSDTQKSTAEVRELCTNCTEHLHEGKMHDCRGNFCLYCKKAHKTGDKNIK